MAKIKIKDDSGDRDFFTIIPNYIANHSTANDQALYFQMKRYAGEEGECFATEQTLMRKLGIGKKAYDKSIEYLTTKGWITFVGLTRGKTRPIKTYKINNIWELNSEYYRNQKINAESTLSKDKSQKEKDTSQKQHKISAESNVEEEPVLTRTIKQEPTSKAVALQGKQWQELIDSFKEINPLYEDFYKIVTERKALQHLVDKLGYDKVMSILKHLPEITSQPYAPKISKPSELRRDLGKLVAFYKQNQNTKTKYGGLKIY